MDEDEGGSSIFAFFVKCEECGVTVLSSGEDVKSCKDHGK